MAKQNTSAELTYQVAVGSLIAWVVLGVSKNEEFCI